MKQALSDNGIQPAARVPGSYRTLGGRERIRPRPGAPATTTLLVGFDSAWTPTNSGSVVGVLQFDDGTYRELGLPRIVNYRQAESVILEWQAEHVPTATIVLLDQPTIVGNAAGQRPVENLVASPVSRRYGGMQPANTARKEMFGEEAPIWRFLARFGGPADPLAPVADTRVFETYPVLAMIALGWTLPDSRPTGRLPKYNPERRTTFSISDWQHVCGLASAVFRVRGLAGIAQWIHDAGGITPPRKHDQDCLDACLCLVVALCVAEPTDCLMVGNRQTGYVIVPYGTELRAELEARCDQTGRATSEWVRTFRALASAQ
jgi:predicted RNase H-like nuclease